MYRYLAPNTNKRIRLCCKTLRCRSVDKHPHDTSSLQALANIRKPPQPTQLLPTTCTHITQHIEPLPQYTSQIISTLAASNTCTYTSQHPLSMNNIHQPVSSRNASRSASQSDIFKIFRIQTANGSTLHIFSSESPVGFSLMSCATHTHEHGL